jgi:hypothetical protein
LTVADARAGLEAVERVLGNDTVDGRTYWFPSSVRGPNKPRSAYLLPLFDEYLIAYKDRRAALNISRWTRNASHGRFSAPIVVSGQVVGGWKRIEKRDSVSIALMPFAPLDKRQATAIADAAQAYARFLGVDLDLSWS